MESNRQKRMTARVRRIASQVAGVQRMIGEDRYCVDVLNQIAAIRSALDAWGKELIAVHLETCVLGHGTGSEHTCAKPLTKDQLMAEVRTVLSRFLR
jgi:DNA-binding FrmR family transcriptional regulator